MAESFEEVPKDEDALLEAEDVGPVPRPQGRRMRLVAGAAASLALVAGAAAWHGRCVPLAGSSARSIISFVETYPGDMVNLVQRDEDQAAVFRWLEAASVVKQTPSPGSDLMGASEAVARAVQTTDPEEVQRIMDEARHRSMSEILARRKNLKEYIASNRRGLRTVPDASPAADGADKAEAAPATGRVAADGDKVEAAAEDAAAAAAAADKPEAAAEDAAAPAAAADADKPAAAAEDAVAPELAAAAADSAEAPADRLGNRNHGGHGHGHHHREPQRQQQLAYCVFDVLQATNSFAFVAANLNDAIRTCPHARSDKIYDPSDKTAAKACAINVATVFSELNYLAAMLSLAANDCAATLVPNTDALCAAGVTGLVWGVGNIATSSALIAASCKTGSDFPVDEVPSEVGSHGGRRLEAEEEAEGEGAAPARKLLFGGGKASTGGQCGLEITDILWSMARFALMINAASNGNIGPIGQCPPNGGHKDDTNTYHVMKTFCSFNVAGILTFYARVVMFIQLAIVDCADVMNLNAICGAGVAGLFASAGGTATTVSVIDPTCGIMNDPLMEKALKDLSRDKHITGEEIATAAAGLLGRRLAEGEEPTGLDFAGMTDSEMYQRFGSPEKAFKSIGIDITDSNAAFRTHQRPQVPDTASIAKLFEQREEPSLFGGGTCSA